jgi:hypothetical protein
MFSITRESVPDDALLRTFRVAPKSGGGTHLQFGSAVAARRGEHGEIPQRPTSFKLLLSFHVLYSQALLHAAKANL